MTDIQRTPVDRPADTSLPHGAKALIEGRHGDPFSVLGMHGGDPVVVRTFQPGATRVWVLDGSEQVAELELAEPSGFFVGRVTGRSEPFAYRMRVEWPSGTADIDDPYRFPPLLGEMDVYLMAEGKHLQLYRMLGAHPVTFEGVEGTRFAVWAPNASRVSVIGEFNQWDGRRHPMRHRVECGAWELFVPGVTAGMKYKYEILDRNGNMLPLKADPVGFRAEHPPQTASVVHGLPTHEFRDETWMKEREDRQSVKAPISVYECHLGSWMRVPEENNRYLSYDEMADRLVSYVSEMGFTHVEFLPVSEYPFDGSWGYQPVGLYAPTIRHGDAEAFARMIDAFHAKGIGVYIDWVPGHFPEDPHGLARFDGTALYEHEDPRLGFHKDWNTLIYNYGRNEVLNFLHSNALYWLDQFHVDGLRVDAVASMLYLNYSREEGEWVPNKFGGNENLEAVDFLRRLNELTFAEYPGTTTIAEESTSWPSVSRPTYVGGLGFGYKWNMGWMHDTLRYIGNEPVYRKYHQNDLTFGLLYAFSENFVLPLSHDEVVHGKRSILGRMPGDEWQRFANLRAYYGFMWMHPGKKLLFMGGEFGQEREWAYQQSLDWHLLSNGYHAGVQRLVRDLNHTYRGTKALHELDCDSAGFEWVDASDTEQSVLSFLRRGEDPEDVVLVVCNFTPIPRHDYRLGVPLPGEWREILNTDRQDYGGGGVETGYTLHASDESWHGRDHSVLATLPPLATVAFAWQKP